jgi:hypothetical protein
LKREVKGCPCGENDLDQVMNEQLCSFLSKYNKFTN